MRGRAVIAIVFLILGASRDLRAQAVDAETLARRGLALRRERHDAGALAAFRQSYALRPAFVHREALCSTHGIAGLRPRSCV